MRQAVLRSPAGAFTSHPSASGCLTTGAAQREARQPGYGSHPAHPGLLLHCPVCPLMRGCCVPKTFAPPPSQQPRQDLYKARLAVFVDTINKENIKIQSFTNQTTRTHETGKTGASGPLAHTSWSSPRSSSPRSVAGFVSCATSPPRSVECLHPPSLALGGAPSALTDE